MRMLLCELQGRFFEHSLKKGFGSLEFVDMFMMSTCAADLDMEFNRLQWLGEAYLMAEFIDEAGDKLASGKQYSGDALFWTGYIYRYWHFLTGESSREISKQAPAKRMMRAYPFYHTVSNKMAVEDLKLSAKGKVYVPEGFEPERKRAGLEKGEFDLAPSPSKRLYRTPSRKRDGPS
ncbi:MAG: hypothetical protein LBH69_00400 [Methanomassiliicoccaceae archaeon]|jgi:hypothetical protein|nr:hypothetical protein [Methanomassiliicoccaceae archaeon]